MSAMGLRIDQRSIPTTMSFYQAAAHYLLMSTEV